MLNRRCRLLYPSPHSSLSTDCAQVSTGTLERSLRRGRNERAACRGQLCLNFFRAKDGGQTGDQRKELNSTIRSPGKTANWRHENWGCNFTPWRSATPIHSRARSRRPNQVRSPALFVVSSALGFFQSKIDRGPSDKKSVASDIRSGRFCRQRWLDLLRARPDGTLPARRGYGRQDSQRN